MSESMVEWVVTKTTGNGRTHEDLLVAPARAKSPFATILKAGLQKKLLLQAGKNGSSRHAAFQLHVLITNAVQAVDGTWSAITHIETHFIATSNPRHIHAELKSW